ncbi:chemotaxis protein [Pseudodesulfovibrio indicus]|uniref:Chemotaxis protein CheV n=1 Tax=Pseudodesulfovibrio indicus TaxID=1716143 RepID=A0A126QS34_9BACT|nr:chemotaxis protein [Pseudodesulfovibrio indicus]AMK12682.1 chemotaxis protein CheV [Pseudodesulfovibrio indicus]TDT91000.1 two-component system chemotaxis response regulator CheV [Pseudodesulfovibrio indicus]
MSETKILLESGTNELEIVEFYLDEARPSGDYRGYYGINVAKVLEIIQMPELTEMPEAAHPSVLGAFNLRNEIIPLIDLAGWLKKKRADGEPPKVIVTEFNRTKSAFLVSGVTRIHRINWQEVEAPTNYVSSLTVNSITGVVKFSNRIVFILDMEKICMDLNPDGASLPETAEKVKEALARTTYRVLLADDSTMARKMIANILTQSGFMVHAEENGELAFKYLLKVKSKAAAEDLPLSDFVHMVVTDIEMPSMDGHSLTRRIKEDHDLRHLPVILCSSIITETLHHKGIAVGADDQVSKAELGDLPAKALRLLAESAN